MRGASGKQTTSMVALALFGMALAGCASPGTLSADSQVPQPESQDLDPHGTPQRTESEVTVEPQGDRYRARQTILVENGVGVDTKRLNILQESTNGGLSVHARPQGGYVMEAQLWADGNTPEEARENLQRMELSHGDTRDGDTLQLQTRVVFRQATVPVVLPDVSTNRGGSLKLTVPEGLQSEITQSGVNGGAAIDGLQGPRAQVSMTNGGIIVEGAFDELDLECTNGGIEVEADRWSDGDSTWRATCTNGGIDIEAVTGPDRGFDVQAQVTNGGIDIDLPDTQEVGQQSRTSQHVRTTGYGDRAYRTAMELEGTNGGIDVSGS